MFIHVVLPESIAEYLLMVIECLVVIDDYFLFILLAVIAKCLFLRYSLSN